MMDLQKMVEDFDNFQSDFQYKLSYNGLIELKHDFNTLEGEFDLRQEDEDKISESIQELTLEV